MTTKKALLALCLSTGFVLVAYYHTLLGGRTSNYDVHLQDPLFKGVRSESGRLVARSQVNFYKIVEQWVQPEGRTNHSTMRKERLIENRHVVRESIQYAENENEHTHNVSQEHPKLISNNSSLYKQKSDIEAKRDSFMRKEEQWKTHHSNRKTLDLLGTNKSAQNGSVVSTKTNEHRWQQQEMAPVADINNHKLVTDERKSLQLDGHAIIHNGSSNSSLVSVYTTKVGSSDIRNTTFVSKFEKSTAEKVKKEKIVFENVPIQPSVKAHGKQIPSTESPKTRLQRVASKNPTHMSDGGESANLHAQPYIQRDSESKNFQVKLQPSPESTRVKSDSGASKNSTKAHMVQIEEFTKTLAQQHKKSNTKSQNESRAKHLPASESTRMESRARPYIVSKKGNTEDHAQPSSKINPELYNVAHIPVKRTPSESTEKGSLLASSKNSIPSVVHREFRLPRAQPPVMLHGETENVVHIEEKQQLAAESTKMKSSVVSKIVTKNNYYEDYKSRSNPAAMVDSTGGNSPKVVGVKRESTYRQTRVVKMGGNKQTLNMSRSTNHVALPIYIANRERGKTDIKSNPQYAHLPESVKKKLIKIQKDREHRIKISKTITTRCEGEKYCLVHLTQYERNHHDVCFYRAIRLEDEGTQLNTCHCRMLQAPTTKFRGRTVYTNFTFPLVALVSLPGSGNTWVRGLLEQATGYCTGSMWCDPMLRAKQFCAEGVRANTLVIKNHDPTIRWEQQRLPVNATQKKITNLNKPTFNSAIFIHRDPYDATVAEWNRALGSIVHNATKYNQTIAGIGFYDVNELKNQHTVSFGKEAFGMFST